MIALLIYLNKVYSHKLINYANNFQGSEMSVGKSDACPEVTLRLL